MGLASIPRGVGHNFTPEYQISAIPYMRTSTINTLTDEGDNVRSFEFPKITQWLSFKADGAMTVYFCKEDAVAEANGLPVGTTASYPFNIRCTKLYFNNDTDGARSLEKRSGLTVIQKEEFSNVVETFLEANN